MILQVRWTRWVLIVACALTAACLRDDADSRTAATDEAPCDGVEEEQPAQGPSPIGTIGERRSMRPSRLVSAQPANKAGLAAIGVQAGGVLLLDKAALLDACRRYRISLLGL
jgi:hypothetical protein